MSETQENGYGITQVKSQSPIRQQEYVPTGEELQREYSYSIVPQYYVEGCHEAIIPRELFCEVQVEIARRAQLCDDKGRRRGYCGKYALTGKVKCGCCDEYIRRAHLGKDPRQGGCLTVRQQSPEEDLWRGLRCADYL